MVFALLTNLEKVVECDSRVGTWDRCSLCGLDGRSVATAVKEVAVRCVGDCPGMGWIGSGGSGGSGGSSSRATGGSDGSSLKVKALARFITLN